MLHDLRLLPIKMRVHLNVLLYTYKGLNDHAPSYIFDMIEIYRSGKPLRYGSQCMLVVPKIRTRGHGGRKFSYAAAILWNDFHSIDLKRVETVFAFKSGLKTYLFKQYFYKK